MIQVVIVKMRYFIGSSCKSLESFCLYIFWASRPKPHKMLACCQNRQRFPTLVPS